jgi:hypothetical protein
VPRVAKDIGAIDLSRPAQNFPGQNLLNDNVDRHDGGHRNQTTPPVIPMPIWNYDGEFPKTMDDHRFCFRKTSARFQTAIGTATPS